MVPTPICPWLTTRRSPRTIQPRNRENCCRICPWQLWQTLPRDNSTQKTQEVLRGLSSAAIAGLSKDNPNPYGHKPTKEAHPKVCLCKVHKIFYSIVSIRATARFSAASARFISVPSFLAVRRSFARSSAAFAR